MAALTVDYKRAPTRVALDARRLHTRDDGHCEPHDLVVE